MTVQSDNQDDLPASTGLDSCLPAMRSIHRRLLAALARNEKPLFEDLLWAQRFLSWVDFKHGRGVSTAVSLQAAKLETLLPAARELYSPSEARPKSRARLKWH